MNTTASPLPDWVAQHCAGDPPTEAEALTWMRLRPVELRELMVMFPPACVVRVREDGQLWIVGSYWSGPDGKGTGLGLRLPEQAARVACHFQHVDVCAYWHGCTPTWVAQIIGGQLTRREAILASLAQGEGYGLEIRKRAEELGVKLTDRWLYPLLQQLVKEGRLLDRQGEPRPERGGRPRFYYRLPGRPGERK